MIHLGNNIIFHKNLYSSFARNTQNQLKNKDVYQDTPNMNAKNQFRGSPCGVGVGMLNYSHIVSEFKLHSHFQTNTRGKGMNSYIPHPGLNSFTTVLLQGWL